MHDGGYGWAAVGVGFAGTMIVLRPGFGEIELGLWLMLGSAVVFAVVLLLLKVLTRTDSPLTITAFGLLFMTLGCTHVARVAIRE